MKLVNCSGLSWHRLNNEIFLCSKFVLNIICAKSFCRNEAVNVNILLVTTLKETVKFLWDHINPVGWSLEFPRWEGMQLGIFLCLMQIKIFVYANLFFWCGQLLNSKVSHLLRSKDKHVLNASLDLPCNPPLSTWFFKKSLFFSKKKLLKSDLAKLDFM